MPGPRNDFEDVRLALSKLDLKTKGNPAFDAIAFMCLAIRKTCSSDSITLGPANKKNGSAALSWLNSTVDESMSSSKLDGLAGQEIPTPPRTVALSAFVSSVTGINVANVLEPGCPSAPVTHEETEKSWDQMLESLMATMQEWVSGPDKETLIELEKGVRKIGEEFRTKQKSQNWEVDNPTQDPIKSDETGPEKLDLSDWKALW